MKKYIRNGKVAVLISSGYGAGWFSWNENYKQILFCPEIVKMVLNKECSANIRIKAQELYPDVYCGGAEGLKVEWIPEGQNFYISEKDGYERLNYIEEKILTIIA